MSDFRFSLRHGSITPSTNDLELYEPFVIYDDVNYKYFLGIKVPDPAGTKDFIYRFLDLYPKSSYPTSTILPDDPPDHNSNS